MHLGEELTFKQHFDVKINKANKGIGNICKLNNILPCHALLRIYRSFVRPDLSYGGVIYDWAENGSVSSKIERVQYNASLAITGATRGIFQEELYQKLGFEFFRTRKKMFEAHVLFLQTSYSSKSIISFQSGTSNLREWNELSTDIRHSTLTNNFRRQISFLILSKFKRINEFLFTLKSSENLWLFDDFRWNRS